MGADGSVTPVRAPLRGFKSIVYALAFSPDGRTLSGGDAEGSLRIWDARTWALQATLAQPNPITSLVYEPTGWTLVSADAAGVIRLWPLPAPTTFQAPGNVYFLQYARSGRLLAVTSGGSGGDVAFWDTAGGAGPRPVASLRPPAGFGPVDGAAAWSSGRRLLAVANAKAKVQLVEVRDLARPELLGPPLTGDTPLVEELAFSPTGSVLAASDDGGKLHLWDVRDPAHPKVLPTLSGPHGPAFSIAFSPDGHLLADASGGGHVWLWDVADRSHPRLLAKLGGFSSYAFSVAFSPAGRTLAAGSGDRTVRMWDVSDPARPRPSGRTLVASGSDQTLHFWDVHTASVAKMVCADAGTSITRTEWQEYAPGIRYDPPLPLSRWPFVSTAQPNGRPSSW